MEKKCCICGTEFIGYGNNAEPIKKGVCCDNCNSRFIINLRILNWHGACEIVRNSDELEQIEKKLEEKNFEQMSEFGSLKRFQNIETEENVILCVV